MIKKLLFAFILLSLTAAVKAQENGSVCGAIFNDLNGDGVFNAGEPGVPGIYITLISAPASEDIFWSAGYRREWQLLLYRPEHRCLRVCN